MKNSFFLTFQVISRTSHEIGRVQRLRQGDYGKKELTNQSRK